MTRIYSDEESLEVRRRLRAGEKQINIAKAIGRSKGSIGDHIAKLRRKGLLSESTGEAHSHSYYRPWTDEDKATYESMAAGGKSDEEISIALGRSIEAIERIRKGHYVPKEKKKGPPPSESIKMIISAWTTDADGSRSRTVTAA